MPGFKDLVLIAFLVLLIPVAFALDTPTISSNTNPEGEWSGFPMEFKWTSIEEADRYCFILTPDSEAEIPIDDSHCSANLAAYPSKKISSGDYYFKVKAVANNGNESSAASHAIMLDIGSPGRAELSAKSNDAGEIELSWTAPEDDASGIKEYEIYRKLMAGFDIRTTPIYEIVDGSALSFTDVNELDQSTTYHYKILAVDNVGNFGSVSNEAHAETAAECDLNITFLVELSSGEDSLELSILSDSKIYHGILEAKLPDGSTYSFFNDAEAFLEWEESFDLSSIDEGYIDLSLTAKEFFGDDCSQSKQFIFDITKPDLTFTSPKYNDRVSETVPLLVEVDDKGSFKSGVDPIIFSVRDGESWTEIGTVSDATDNVYLLNWDSFTVENGQQRIKAVVVDKGGNQAEATQTLNVLNAFDGAVDLNSALTQTGAGRKEAFESRWELDALAIVSDKVDSLIEEADSNFAEGTRLAELEGLENETNAKIFLATAMALYTRSQGIVSVSTYQTADFVFNKEQSGILLTAAGISGPTMAVAQQMIEKADPKRQLKILKVVDDNSTYYRATIEVSFSLDTNILADSNSQDIVMQVIEAVPKEFAEYAAQLDSNISFVVLDDDPKLSFALTRTQYKKKKFSYVLEDDLSQKNADDLISENIVNKFVAPPILLPPETVVSGFSVSLEVLLFIGISLAVIVLVVIAALVVKSRKSKPRSGLGAPARKFAKKEPAKPLSKKEKKAPFWKKGKSPLSGLKMPSLGKKKESPLNVFGKK